MTPAAAAERAARDARGRLLALLVPHAGGLAAAEDALASAFAAALRRWPQAGVPVRPEAWLLVAARHALAAGRRHGRVRAAAAPALRLLAGAGDDPSALPDRRLELLLLCAHPLVEPRARTPLMLQVVLGLDAARIAAAFLESPAAMAQRLVRAKARLRAARPGFERPGPAELPARLESLLEAIYGAHAAAPDAALREEALWLARLVASLLPAEGEAQALLALLLHVEARRPAGRDGAGRYRPLSAQDPARWDAALAAQAEAALASAARLGRPGRFGIEAAIASFHAARARGLVGGMAPLLALHEALEAFAPTAGARAAHAAALLEAGQASAALARLDQGGGDPGFQPWWAVRAEALHRLGQEAAAREAWRRAAGLATDPAVRDWLLERAGLIPSASAPPPPG